MTARRVGATLVAVLVLAAAACRTSRPDGAPFEPLTATNDQEALAQLMQRRADAPTARSLMRARFTSSNGKTQSFRGLMEVSGATLDLTVYTPLGTTAAVLHADGKRVQIDNRVERSTWEGDAEELARSFGFFGSEIAPAELGYLLLGFPVRESAAGTYAVEPGGIRKATVHDFVVEFDPPAFPAKNVVLTRANERLEIEHLEVTR